MTTKKYHVTPEGVHKECSAVFKCPYSDEREHLTTEESAKKMAEFQNELKVNFYGAINSVNIESFSTNELYFYRRAVTQELSKLPVEADRPTTNVDNLLSEQEKQEIYKQARQKIMDEGFRDKLESVQAARKNFNMRKDWSGVPVGLTKGITNKKIAKLFINEVFLDENRQLETNPAKLTIKLQKLKDHKIFKNFQNVFYANLEVARNNYKQYQLASIDDKILEQELHEATVKRADLLEQAHPKLREAKSNYRQTKQTKINDRKTLIGKLNKELLIRRNLEDYKLQDSIQNRLTSDDIEGTEYSLDSLSLKQNSKNSIDNLFLLTEKGKLLKVTKISPAGYIEAHDKTGFPTKVTYQRTNPAIRCDLEKDFVFISTQSDSQEDYKGNLTLKKATS